MGAEAAAAAAAVTVSLGTLRDLLIEEVRFVSGVDEEVNQVESDLRSIHAMLKEADAKKSISESPVLKEWMAQLQGLAYRAENVLEKYAYVQSKRQGKGLKEKFQRYMCILGEWCSVRGVGNETIKIRSRLSDLTTKLRPITGGGEGTSNSADQSRLTYAHEHDKHFVGMKEDIKSLVSMVKDDSAVSKSVISIYGMGGLGKTTLARKIYNHPDIQGCFECRAWVCVTQQFQAETVLRQIFLQIDEAKKDDIMKMELQQLVTELHNSLKQKKCLIVIDDIWKGDHWVIINPALPKDCKVLVTTRDEKIIPSHQVHLYPIPILTEDECWSLLHKIAFDQVSFQGTLESFEKIGKEMVRECGFVPLAISVIGGALHQKELVRWVEVSSKMDAFLKHGGEGIKRDERVKQILDLSFNALPYYLKPCLLYLACFPEDSEIHTEQLYLLWMAEGLISREDKGNHEGLRDVAERYLSELAFRCMVQVSGECNFPHNKFVSCRLHDLMHDLCSSKAEEEKFIKRVDISRHQQDIPSSVGVSIHRLAINVIDEDDDVFIINEKCLQEVKDLRSLLILQKSDYVEKMFTSDTLINFESCKKLRILSLEGFRFKGEKMPSGIRKLIHLKYMSLGASKVKKLPRQVCHLPYLQTLDLTVLWEVELEVPNHIWKMKRLRHLFLLPWTMKVIGGGKLKLAGLKELETLEGVNSRTARIADIITLTNLRRLKATIEGDEECLATTVDYMSSHECSLLGTRLTIKSCNLRDVVEKMSMIPSLIGLNIEKCEIGCSFPSLHNLVELLISECEIEGDVMDVLGKFPMLQHLWLEEVGVKTEWIFDANSFPQLKYLRLWRLCGLRKWEVETGAMPKLRMLFIRGCVNLEKLPDGLRFISTLETLKCHDMSEEFTDRMRRDGGEDYANFSHIPDLYIGLLTDECLIPDSNECSEDTHDAFEDFSNDLECCGDYCFRH